MGGDIYCFITYPTFCMIVLVAIAAYSKKCWLSLVVILLGEINDSGMFLKYMVFRCYKPLIIMEENR